LYILGISCYFHDSAAALIENGNIVVAVQEERFSRLKHDSNFPCNAISYCLNSQKIDFRDIEAVIYYEKPLLTFERLLETYLETAPRGVRSFIASMEVWLKEKIFLKSEIKKNLENIQKELLPNLDVIIPKLLFSEHHLSHAAAAFYPSPFEKSAILCMDAVGEWATTSAWIGNGNKIKLLWEINFPHSLGLLYSAFTFYCGFKVNSGEYKLMGLAPYGTPRYSKLIKEKLIEIKEDGSFRLDMSYFKYHRGFKMTSNKFHKLFKREPRLSNQSIEEFHMDLAASIQEVTEEVVLKIARNLKKETGASNLCLAGGVALNCVANGKLLKEKIFNDIWIQPASGDAGSSIGSALIAYYDYFENIRYVDKGDSMRGAFLGPSYSNNDIVNYLKSIKATYRTLDDLVLFDEIAKLIDQGYVIGWFNGAMEFGPRALGARSIIGDPRNPKMQSLMNLKIKYRESFRPFAPAIMKEHVSEQFELKHESPYMLLVAPVKKNLCNVLTDEESKLKGLKKLNVLRSNIPAVTHVDKSARVQTVASNSNPRFYKLLSAFKKLTNCSSLINTSFNVRGEPIVCSPQDAFRCFMRTEIDILVLENQILYKDQQYNIKIKENWNQEFLAD
tara:strand:+ start:2783 stop:4633 length:1851 start_codon:yes stop_codon:yes gene_type:complete